MGETFKIEKILHGLGKASLLTFSPRFQEASWGTTGVKKPVRDWAWRPALSRQCRCQAAVPVWRKSFHPCEPYFPHL